jgi:transcriptional regulator with XRE-family HTH domain
MIRKTFAYSQGQMARALGVKARASISGYERGEREPPLPVLLGYARFAGIMVDVLIDDNLDYPDDKSYPQLARRLGE